MFAEKRKLMGDAVRPYFKHDEVFPIIEKILTDYSRHSTDYMEERDIVKAMMQDEQGGIILERLPKHHSISWWAHNMQAFFSKVITQDKTVPPRFMKFNRKKINEKWAYRVASEGKPNSPASSELKQVSRGNMESNENSNGTSVLVGGPRTNKSVRRAPGVRAKKFGKVLERGAATQVMIYPRPATKAAIVEGSRRSKKSLSSFCVLSALKETASLLGCGIGDLGISEQELNNYV